MDKILILVLTVKAAEKSKFHSSNCYVVQAGDCLRQTCEGRNDERGQRILSDELFVAYRHLGLACDILGEGSEKDQKIRLHVLLPYANI